MERLEHSVFSMAFGFAERGRDRFHHGDAEDTEVTE